MDMVSDTEQKHPYIVLQSWSMFLILNILQVLKSMTTNRITASQKMVLGVGKTMKEKLIDELKQSKFSFNIDEAMSDSHKKILTILVSYFSPSLFEVSLELISLANFTPIFRRVYNSNKSSPLLQLQNIKCWYIFFIRFRGYCFNDNL